MKKLISAPYLSKKPIFFTAIVVLMVIVLAYWLHSRHFVSTNNSYINANIIQIAPRIGGQVTKLAIHNNQFVTQGQTLFEIDPAPLMIALSEAKAQLAKSQAEFTIAQQTESRTLKLVQKNVASKQQGDTAESELQAAFASIQLAKANLDRALLNLQYATVTAPASGWVTNVTLRVGSMVDTNQPLFALINDSEFWVDANFKETDISHIQPGQMANIKIDMYPNHEFKGLVESISGGSGSVFSLLPPQNATGNWVKVTQRVPVRVRILHPDNQYPLRIGTSATVVIRVG